MGSPEYELDPDDGLRREIVGPWAREKHALLMGYIDASRAARRKMQGRPCFVDLYCGPGRIRCRDESHAREGGVLAALKASRTASRGSPTPFARIFIADAEASNTSACSTRLQQAGTDFETFTGKAEDTVGQVIARLPRDGLHLAYLDPYSIDALSFTVIRQFSRAKHVDLLIHFASADLKRNLAHPEQAWRFERMAPGWDRQPHDCGLHELRRRFIDYWQGLVNGCGYKMAARRYRISNSKRAELYLLLSVSKHPLADKLWSGLRPSPQTDMFSS
jgi:three-Cys-motif partner protein